jgi:hypothetical protein
MILFVSVIFIALLYWVLFGGLFVVNSVNLKNGDNGENIKLFVENGYLGANLTMLSVSEVERTVLSEFPLANQVFVRKIFPSTLEISVDQIDVDAAFLSFDTWGIFDSEYRVHNLEEVENPIVLNDKQLEWLSGDINPDSEYIQEKYLETLNETEIAEFDWSEVATEQKQAILDQLAFETRTIINQYFEIAVESVAEVYGGVPIIKVHDFTNGNTIEQERIGFTIDVIDFISENTEIKITDIVWESDIRLRIVTEQNERLIFGAYLESTREEQLARLLSLYRNNQMNSGSEYDFRSTTFTIRN